MRFFIPFLLSVVITLTASTVVAETVIVVTDSTHPISNIPSGARLIKLDRPLQLHEKLSANLPNDPAQAAQIASSRLAVSGNELQTALQEVVDAWALGIVKVPAVVLGNYVVYGVTDVAQATALIKAYQAKEQQQ